MKKGILGTVFLFVFIALSVRTLCAQKEKVSVKPQRSLFVSVIQDPPVLSSREGIQKLVAFSKKNGIKTLFVQIYRANKAWFPSKLADASPYQDSFRKVGEDPFAMLIREAHQSGIEVHAWMNLLSLSANENAPILKKYGVEVLTRDLKKKNTIQDYKIDNQYFLEPGDFRVREDLSGILHEVVSAYPRLDGIQLDYIRYPDTHPFYGFTEMNMRRFKKSSGRKEIREDELWKNWKRAQVTELLELLVRNVRKANPRLQISTTGCAPYARAYAEAFQDWPSWLNRGLVDFVTLMSYPAELALFEKQIKDAKLKTTHFDRVNIAVGAYKLLAAPDVFSSQLRGCETAGARGCAVFHYENLLKNSSLAKALE